MVNVESTGLLALSSGKGRDILNFGLPAKQRLPKTGLPGKSAVLTYADSNGCPNCAGAEWIIIQFHSHAIEKEPEKDATAGE